MAINFQLPKGPGGEPVVVVAVKDDRRAVVDACIAQQPLDLVLRRDIADERVAKLRRPVPAGGAWDMTLIVGGRIDVDLRNSDRWIGNVLSDPIGAHQYV